MRHISIALFRRTKRTWFLAASSRRVVTYYRPESMVKFHYRRYVGFHDIYCG